MKKSAKSYQRKKSSANGISPYYYGIHAVESILKHSPHTVIELFIAEGGDNDRLHLIISLAEQQGISVQYVKKQQLNDLAQGQHQGLVARCKRDNLLSEHGLDNLLERLQVKSKSPLLLLLDGVTDPQNLGACLRSADAFGVDAIIMPKDNSANLTPAAVKIASGAAETVPLFLVTNLTRCIEQLKQQGIWIYGTALSEQAKPLQTIKFAKAAALVMGAEGKGLRQLTMKHCDELVYLPMQGYVDSLNVATATAVFLFAMTK